MLSRSEFTVSETVPTDFTPEITTALPTGHMHMVKTYTGDVVGRSITQFTFAFDSSSGAGTYVAMESFEGTIGDRQGTFNFVHAASTSGNDRSNEYGLIVPGSGTGDLTGIEGTVRLIIDSAGERMEFDHSL